MQNPITAIKYMEKLISKINSLNCFPYRGAIYGTYYNRFLVHQNYLIFYEIQEKQIIVKRIIHKNVNIENIDFYLL